MFDLEKSVATWRQQMLAAGFKSPGPLDELESHLLEEVERRIASGASAQEAFAAAVAQVGPADEIIGEFAKLPSGHLPIRYVSLFCYLGAPLLAVVNLWALQPGEVNPVGRLVSFGIMACAALYLVSLPNLHKRLPNPDNPAVRIVMWAGYLLALLWPVFATLVAIGALPVQVGIVAEMVIWSVGAAWFGTWLAHWATGKPDLCGGCPLQTTA